MYVLELHEATPPTGQKLTIGEVDLTINEKTLYFDCILRK